MGILPRNRGMIPDGEGECNEVLECRFREQVNRKQEMVNREWSTSPIGGTGWIPVLH